MIIPYLYRATVVSVTDGDTIVADLDLGFNITIRDSFRFYGINAPEKSVQAGLDAKAYLQSRLPIGTPIVVQTHKNKQEKFGRWLAKIFLNDVNINEEMVKTGHASPYLDNIKEF
jgi:micrococcal nuclease